MLYTDNGTKVTWEWCPLAVANGLEWSRERKGMADRFDCLYRRGLANKLLWHVGALWGRVARAAIPYPLQRLPAPPWRGT